MKTAVQQLGKYRIGEEVGRGGFATVYRAMDSVLEREVALKILHPQLLMDTTFVERFLREARTLARLRHPNIITIFDVGKADGRLYIAMELARDPSLEQFVAQRTRISWQETLDLLEPVCAALKYAHQQNIVHRDVKPSNILMDDGQPLLSDFSFARLVGQSNLTISMSGGIVGTPGYIAPEIWEHDAAGAPADVYALGCVLYEMLTGDVLFTGETPIQVMWAHAHGPTLPAQWPDDVPASIDDVLCTALARQPAARYADAGEFWRALNRLHRWAGWMPVSLASVVAAKGEPAKPSRVRNGADSVEVANDSGSPPPVNRESVNDYAEQPAQNEAAVVSQSASPAPLARPRHVYVIALIFALSGIPLLVVGIGFFGILAAIWMVTANTGIPFLRGRQWAHRLGLLYGAFLAVAGGAMLVTGLQGSLALFLIGILMLSIAVYAMTCLSRAEVKAYFAPA